MFCMKSDEVEIVRAKLERLRGQWQRVSRESGVPYTTIKNLMQRVNQYPRLPTLDKLTAYLNKP